MVYASHMKIKLFISKYHAFVLLGLATFLSIASVYFQWVLHLEPCPLCIAQRIAIFMLTVLYFLALFTQKRISIIVNTSFTLFFALFGAGMAGRQIWVMTYPPLETSGCLPDISILWHYLPFSDLLKIFFNGTAGCLEQSWHWLGMTMPEWSCVFFVFFAFMAIWRFWQRAHF